MEFFIPVGLIYHLSLSPASAAPGCCQHNSTLILHNGFQCEFSDFLMSLEVTGVNKSFYKDFISIQDQQNK